MLIHDRKYDIRLWVLITHDHRCFCFKEGYIRMSSHKYTLDDDDLENLAIHLTNNAIQKKDKDYGKHEDGNILSFKQGQEATGVDFDAFVQTDILPIIETTLIAARQKINKNNRKFCFEILGYDFMIDNELKPWLIEVNTNPCIEESNAFLK